MELSALSELVPDPEAFLSESPPEPIVWTIPPRSAAARLDLGDLDRLASEQILLGNATVRIFRAGQALATSEFTWGDRALDRGFDNVVRPSSITGALKLGYSVLFDALHRTWMPVGDMCRRLSLELGVPAMAGAIVTPANNQGFTLHYDAFSAFVVQSLGSKRWQIYDPVLIDPLPHQLWDPGMLSDSDRERLEHGEPTLEVTLSPGDVLWLPRGWLHRAFSTSEPSVHVNVAFRSFTPYSIAQQLVRRLDAVDTLRRELPWGISHNDEELARVADSVLREVTEALKDLQSADLLPEIREGLHIREVEESHAPISSAFGDGSRSFEQE